MITEAKLVTEPSELIEMISETSLSYRHDAIFARLCDDRLDLFNPGTKSIICYHTLTDAHIPTIRLYDDEPVLAAIDTKGTRDFLQTAGNSVKAHIYLQRSPREPVASQIISHQKLRATIAVELNPRFRMKKLVERIGKNVRIKQIPETPINQLRDSFDSSGQWSPPSRDIERFLRAETHISELERITDLKDHVSANKKLKNREYPLKFCDDQLVLDYEDSSGNCIKGNLSSEQIHGPDYYHHYGKGFRSVVKRLSGPVELHIAPDGTLALVKRKRGKILRYLIGSKDKKS